MELGIGVSPSGACTDRMPRSAINMVRKPGMVGERYRNVRRHPAARRVSHITSTKRSCRLYDHELGLVLRPAHSLSIASLAIERFNLSRIYISSFCRADVAPANNFETEGLRKTWIAFASSFANLR